MFVYLINTKVMLKYPDVFGLDPRDLNRKLEQDFLIFTDSRLPKEIEKQASGEGKAYLANENGIEYEISDHDFFQFRQYRGPY